MHLSVTLNQTNRGWAKQNLWNLLAELMQDTGLWMHDHSVYRAGHDSRLHILICTQADCHWSGTQTGPFRTSVTCNLQSWIYKLNWYAIESNIISQFSVSNKDCIKLRAQETKEIGFISTYKSVEVEGSWILLFTIWHQRHLKQLKLISLQQEANYAEAF